MEENMNEKKIPINEKYTLTVREAAKYFGIGINKMRRLAEDNIGVFAVCNGNRYLVIRSKFEEFLQKTSAVYFFSNVSS